MSITIGFEGNWRSLGMQQDASNEIASYLSPAKLQGGTMETRSPLLYDANFA